MAVEKKSKLNRWKRRFDIRDMFFSRVLAGLIEQRMIVVGVMVIKVNLVC